jgi:hypothetical protein
MPLWRTTVKVIRAWLRLNPELGQLHCLRRLAVASEAKLTQVPTMNCSTPICCKPIGGAEFDGLRWINEISAHGSKMRRYQHETFDDQYPGLTPFLRTQLLTLSVSYQTWLSKFPNSALGQNQSFTSDSFLKGISNVDDRRKRSLRPLATDLMI